MPKACYACGKFISTTGAASCSVCQALYHKACVALPEASPVGKGWVCPACTTRTRTGDNTPVKPATHDALESTRGAAAQRVTPAVAQRATPAAAPSTDMQDMRQELAAWMAEMREFRREMSEFRASIGCLSERMDTFEQRLHALEQRREEIPTEVADLRCKVALLQQELNDRDQDSLLSDLEIGHLPEEKGENLVHTVTVLAARIGITLEERDIVFAERMGAARGAVAQGEAPFSRRVVVRLARRYLRDQMLQGARTRRHLTSNDAGRDPSAIVGATASPRTRIFLNERLTRFNRQLFYRVREECRTHQWKYSWTKRGRVYAKQADGKQAYPIRSEVDVERVFGTSSV